MSGSPLPVGVKCQEDYPIVIPWELSGKGKEIKEMFGRDPYEVYREFNADPRMLDHDKIFNTAGPYLAIYYLILKGRAPPAKKEIEELLDWIRKVYREYASKAGKVEKADFLRHATRVALGIDENGWYEEFKGLKRYLPKNVASYLDLLCEYALTGDDRKRTELENVMFRMIKSQDFYTPYEAKGFVALVNYWQELRERKEKTKDEELDSLIQDITISY